VAGEVAKRVKGQAAMRVLRGKKLARRSS
jgi:hypothetical protein